MNRLPARLDGALALAAAGALLLLISLFLDWFEPGLSAFDVFEIVDLGLVGVAVGVLAIAVQATAVEAGEENARTDWLLPLGAAALAIVLFEIVDNPPAAAKREIAAGAWLAMIGALGILAGSLLWRSRLSLVLTLRPREKSPAAPAEPPAPATSAAPASGPAAASARPAESDPEPATGEDDVIVPDPYEPSPRATPGGEPATPGASPATPAPAAPASPPVGLGDSGETEQQPLLPPGGSGEPRRGAGA